MKNFTDNSSLKSYTDNSEQNSHTDIHTVEIEYTCDQFFLDKSAILKHVETNNCHLKPGKKYYQSCNCNQTSSQTTDIPSHIGTNTGDCDENISKENDLKRHHQVYNCDKPYNCRKCDKAFSINNSTEHQRTHTSGKAGKPYKCTYCDKSFSVNNCLIRHLRTHTGEKPYKCSACHKSFAVKSSLIRHMRTHTLEKPYKCTQCDKAFSDNRSLIKHILGVPCMA